MNPSKHERQLRRARATGGYFLFFRNYGRLLDKEEALLLQDLINREDMIRLKQIKLRKTKRRQIHAATPDGYFRCTFAFLQNENYLVWTEREQRRLFPLLERKGYISTTKRGSPPRRWVRIHYLFIEDQLDTLLDPEDQEVYEVTPRQQ